MIKRITDAEPCLPSPLFGKPVKHRRVILLLLLSLSFPSPVLADNFSDMFGFMFRMMFSMMNAMTDIRGYDSRGWGQANPYLSPGPTAFPGMHPMHGLAGIPGYGGFPANAWSYPRFPPAWNNSRSIYGGGRHCCPMGRGWNRRYGGPGFQPYPVVTPLDGQWVGSRGEFLEVRGNRFRLRNGWYVISGTLQANNNFVSLYTPRTGVVTRYTFFRSQNALLLRSASGLVLDFRRHTVRRYP